MVHTAATMLSNLIISLPIKSFGIALHAKIIVCDGISMLAFDFILLYRQWHRVRARAVSRGIGAAVPVKVNPPPKIAAGRCFHHLPRFRKRASVTHRDGSHIIDVCRARVEADQRRQPSRHFEVPIGVYNVALVTIRHCVENCSQLPYRRSSV
jgi:hypothetical protein